MLLKKYYLHNVWYAMHTITSTSHTMHPSLTILFNDTYSVKLIPALSNLLSTFIVHGPQAFCSVSKSFPPISPPIILLSYYHPSIFETVSTMDNKKPVFSFFLFSSREEEKKFSHTLYLKPSRRERRMKGKWFFFWPEWKWGKRFFTPTSQPIKIFSVAWMTACPA